MAGKHSKNEKKSKAPVVIIIVIAVIAAIAAVFAVLYFNGAFGSKDNKSQENTTPTASAVPYTTAQAVHGQEQTSAQSTEQSSQTEQTNAVVVPTEAEGDVTHFNATFVPNGKVVDTVSGNNTSLKEVFGTGYNTSGVLTFNNDGTFSDTVSSHEPATGGYAVQNNKISATYSNDKNMDITVTEWDGNTPVSFYVVYAGYQVYFG